MLFIDESGRLLPPNKNETKHFVLGGVVIPELIWSKLAADLLSLKNKYHVQGEIKWRYFAPNSDRPENTLRHIPLPERNILRTEIFQALSQYPSIKVIYTVADVESLFKAIDFGALIHNEQKKWKEILPSHIYHASYCGLVHNFQLHLENLASETGQEINGLVVCDHRNPHEDAALRELHQELISMSHLHLFPELYSGENAMPAEEMLLIPALCANFIEGLFLAPSHHSVGIQFADMVAGAVFRKYEKGDDGFYSHIEKLVFKPPS